MPTYDEMQGTIGNLLCNEITENERALLEIVRQLLITTYYLRKDLNKLQQTVEPDLRELWVTWPTW